MRRRWREAVVRAGGHRRYHVELKFDELRSDYMIGIEENVVFGAVAYWPTTADGYLACISMWTMRR